MKLNGIYCLLLCSIAFNSWASKCDKYFTTQQLHQLKANEFVEEDSTKRQATAIGLVNCIDKSDPEIRDGIVFEGLSFWLRNQQLTIPTTQTLFSSFNQILSTENTDPNNFSQPFAALILAEVVRVDRISPYLTDKQRQEVVNTATNYMASIDDYRGFDDTTGWRHAVAHSADLFLQLALNKQITAVQLKQLLEGISSQVVAKNQHFYHYGEPKRLALATIYIVLRGELTQPELQLFFDNIVDPSPFENWHSVYGSNIGLAKLHNSRSFLSELYTITASSKNPQLEKLRPIIKLALKKL